jgi:hypothetical protein
MSSSIFLHSCFFVQELEVQSVYKKEYGHSGFKRKYGRQQARNAHKARKVRLYPVLKRV